MGVRKLQKSPSPARKSINLVGVNEHLQTSGDDADGILIFFFIYLNMAMKHKGKSNFFLVDLLRRQTLMFNASTEVELPECLDDDNNTVEKEDESEIVDHQMGEDNIFDELVLVTNDAVSADGVESDDCSETTQPIVDEKPSNCSEYVQEIRMGRSLSKLI